MSGLIKRLFGWHSNKIEKQTDTDKNFSTHSKKTQLEEPIKYVQPPQTKITLNTVKLDKVRIFISYSHRGNGPKWKAALLRALQVFEKHHLLDIWEDGKIRVSAFWNDDITEAMANAQLAVVLLTKEVLESQYILERELPFLRNRQQQDKLPVFPVICEPCEWRAHDWLRATQAPNNSNPLSELPDEKVARIFQHLATEIAEQLSHKALNEFPKPDKLLPPTKLYLERFPLVQNGKDPIKLIGREQELALLDLTFAQPHTAVISLVAWGGVGKTILVQHWLNRLQHEQWFGIQRVYAWSFYSQGTSEDRQGSEDMFLIHALEWFGVKCDPTTSPWDKGRLLADAVASERTLLILDGIEPLQYPPGPMGGQLRAPGLESLLKQLACKAKDTEHRGLCLVTTREPLTDLADFQRRPDAAWGSVLRVDLANLTEEAGAVLLHHAGAKRAGATEIKDDDAELIAASREVDGHALTLNLLARFLARAHGGDIRCRDLVKFEEADCKEQGGTTFKMLAAFENWFAKSGEFGARQLAILRILGLFNGAIDSICLAALRNPPIINGLTNSLFTKKPDGCNSQASMMPIIEEDWNTVVSFLSDFGLVKTSPLQPLPVKGFNEWIAQTMSILGPDARIDEDYSSIELNLLSSNSIMDAHPLIREYFEMRLRMDSPTCYMEGHKRIFDALKESVPYWPKEISGLTALYDAVFHGCKVGEYEEARANIFRDRILRGTMGHCANYSTFSLGAAGADLTALVCFFEQPWNRITSVLSDTAKAWVLNETAFRLRLVGRMVESIEPLRAATDLSIRLGDWNNAAIDAGNLSELYLILGDIPNAVKIAESSVCYADHVENGIWSIHMRARLAEAFHQFGRLDDAHRLFHEAELMQQRLQPDFHILYSYSGFRYCALLLSETERASWAISTLKLQSIGRSANTSDCWLVQKLTYQKLRWLEQKGNRLLDIALDTLTLNQSVFYRTVLDHYTAPNPEFALRKFAATLGPLRYQFTLVIEGLSRAHSQEFIPLAFLTRAWVRFLEHDIDGAQSDLDEAWQIAERGPMRLHMADIHLHRARLFYAMKPYPWNKDKYGKLRGPTDDLADARALIEKCGYWRRKDELEDAEKAALSWV